MFYVLIELLNCILKQPLMVKNYNLFTFQIGYLLALRFKITKGDRRTLRVPFFILTGMSDDVEKDV